ncbi:reverse transcriptase domain-containing protein [Streptomyces albipurpureus]|uniref:Reverse transcriptase domain-containing protein n=1 Tax=Streptomyces albipurpureus TaxID=2897419 RepID=A0ABT0UVA8_9ACTN|nr:reverse transcriptase/maturase family protein [Streptomyces sp. CWNU-1]MCM2392517.1 reverse transcriptase domain-containing protein [Streptomyces sp. CWNU-1]
MQRAEALMEIIHERGKRGLPLERLYRHLFNPELYLRAYGKIYRNDGSMTPGSTTETVDGMSLKKIQVIIDALRHERYRWTPVRRVYIEKKGSPGKRRPLGLPSWSDKLLQEVIRSLLEAYYEPQFSNRSHGFRPGKGRHTALTEVSESWRSMTWFIEGDISQCFDRLDHGVLHSTLAENIHDNRFLRLIEGLLQAGYLEEWRYHETLSGAPQGGVLSPLLSNIYLDRLDKYVETTLLPVFNQGARRKPYLPYMRIHKASWKLEKKGQREEAKQLRRQLQKLPSHDPNDPGFRRLHYVRYADDWLLGFSGTRREAEYIKEMVGKFLRNRLKLELSEKKTLITHGRSQAARFLGYEIVVHHNDAKHDRNGHRSINGQIGLKVPMDVVRDKRKTYMRRGKPAAMLTRAHDSDFRIVTRYQAEFRGIAEYYQLAYNRHRLGLLRWVMERSMTKTLGHKNKVSVNKVWNRYRATWQTPAGPRRGLQVTVGRGNGKRPLVARWGGISLARRTTRVILKDNLPEIWRKRPAELIDRLMSGRCELCQSRTDVEVHHVRRLKDLLSKTQAEQPDWAQQMASRHRKTLIVCRDCHDGIHNGSSTGQASSNVVLESRVR